MYCNHFVTDHALPVRTLQQDPAAEKQLYILVQHPDQVFPCDAAECSGSLRHHSVRKVPLHLLKLQDVLLDRMFCDEFEYGDLILLTDPVGTVCRLVLRRHIPPRIVMDHHIRSCQV